MVGTRAEAIRRFARTDEGALFGAILTLLIAGMVAAIFAQPHGQLRSIQREHGSLVAPPTDSTFTQGLAAPEAPSAVTDGSVSGGTLGKPPTSPRSPSTPAPPGPSTPAPPPPDKGLLPDLPILPPPLPVPR
jgi:hypothetical protein